MIDKKDDEQDFTRQLPWVLLFFAALAGLAAPWASTWPVGSKLAIDSVVLLIAAAIVAMGLADL